MMVRGGRCWFAVDSKSFEILVDEVKGSLRGVVVERGRGHSSWVRFGEHGLQSLLEVAEGCCRDKGKMERRKEWMEGGRSYSLACRENRAGKFISCRVVTEEGRTFCLIFPEGKGFIGGWSVLAEKLRSVGVLPMQEKSVTLRKRTIGFHEASSPVKESFVEIVSKRAELMGESAWLELSEEEVLKWEESFRHCLVGRWATGTYLDLKFEELERWAVDSWRLRKGLKISVFGGSNILFRFEDGIEAERVLARGLRFFGREELQLKWWSLESACVLDESSYKEAWVRVLGLPLHLWNREMFRKIGNSCGGFLELDEATVNKSHFQWARLLVRRSERFKPNMLQIVVGRRCYAIQLWWEVPPIFSVTEPRKMEEKTSLEVRDDLGDNSRAVESGDGAGAGEQCREEVAVGRLFLKEGRRLKGEASGLLFPNSQVREDRRVVGDSLGQMSRGAGDCSSDVMGKPGGTQLDGFETGNLLGRAGLAHKDAQWADGGGLGDGQMEKGAGPVLFKVWAQKKKNKEKEPVKGVGPRGFWAQAYLDKAQGTSIASVSDPSMGLFQSGEIPLLGQEEEALAELRRHKGKGILTSGEPCSRDGGDGLRISSPPSRLPSTG